MNPPESLQSRSGGRADALWQLIHLSGEALAPEVALQRASEIIRRAFDWQLVACSLNGDAELGRWTAFDGQERDNAPPDSAVMRKFQQVSGAHHGLRDRDGRFCTPLVSSRGALGMLVAQNQRGDDVAAHQRFLVMVADLLTGIVRSGQRADRLRQQARLMELMAEVSRRATAEVHLKGLLKAVVDHLESILPVAVASVVMLDESRQKFAYEIASSDLELHERDDWPITVGACGRCVRTGKAQLIEDVDADSDYFPGNPSIESEYILPIFHGSQILGVLNFEATEHGVFTSPLRDLLRGVADQIAGALHLAETNEMLERSNEALLQLNEKLKRQSEIDGLTGVANRRRFNAVLKRVLDTSGDKGLSIAVLLADLDHFKPLNDSHGHLYGDDCLRQVAHILESSLQVKGGLVSRFGGEEFAIVLPGLSLTQALAVAEQLRSAVSDLKLKNEGSPRGDHLTISIGVTAELAGSNSISTKALLDTADQALYKAKHEGRDRVASLSP